MSFDLKLNNGDLQIGSNGDLSTVSDTDKLIQDLLKIVLTPINGNPFQPSYGSYLTNTLIGSILDDNFTISSAQTQIITSLQNYMKEQKKQAQRQIVTPAESLAAVQKVEVIKNPVDSRFWEVAVNVLTRDFTAVPTIQFNIGPV